MSWHFSLAVVEEFSAAGFLDSEQCAQLRSTRIAEKSCYGAKRKATSKRSRSGTTPEPSTVQLGVERWISSLRASRASRSASPANGKPSWTKETSGRRPFASFEKSGRDGVCLKMSQACLPGLTDTSGPSSETLPKAGLMLDGMLFRLRTLGRTILESGCGLWPTPRTCSGLRSSGMNRTEFYRQMFPTPTAGEHTQNQGGGQGQVGPIRYTLVGMARYGTWPTPTSSMVTVGDLNQAKYAGNSGNRPDYATANRMLPTPTAAAKKRSAAFAEGRTLMPHEMLPTPKARDGDNRGAQAKRYLNPARSNDLPDAVAAIQGRGGQLNPTWVAWLMGWPLNWTSLEPLPAESMQEWLASTDWWQEEPDIPRTCRGTPYRVDRLKALGNGQVPRCAAYAFCVLAGKSNG